MELDPANVFTATQMADTLTWLNDWEKLEYLLSQWISRYPDSRDLKGYQVRAKMFHHGDLESARKLLDLLLPWPGIVYTSITSDLLRLERDFDGLLAIQDTAMFIQGNQLGEDVGQAKGIAFYLKGDKQNSALHLQKQVDYLLAREPTGGYEDAFSQAGLGLCLSYLDQHEKALEASQKAMQMLPQEKDHLFGTMIFRNHTLLLARAGKRDEVLEILAATLDKTEGYSRWQLYLDPQWDFFRDDERFNELVRPLSLKEGTK